MTVLELLAIMALLIATICGAMIIAYLAVIEPLQISVRNLEARLIQQSPVQAGHARHAWPVPSLMPTHALPDMDAMPDKAWEVGSYGEDYSTAEEIEEQMSEFQTAHHQANLEWLDMENLKHGKNKPLIYSGG